MYNNIKVYITCKIEITCIVSKQWHCDSDQDSISSIWALNVPFTFWIIGRLCLGFWILSCLWSTVQAQCMLVTFFTSWMLVPLGCWYLLDIGMGTGVSVTWAWLVGIIILAKGFNKYIVVQQDLNPGLTNSNFCAPFTWWARKAIWIWDAGSQIV